MATVEDTRIQKRKHLSHKSTGLYVIPSGVVAHRP